MVKSSYMEQDQLDDICGTTASLLNADFDDSTVYRVLEERYGLSESTAKDLYQTAMDAAEYTANAIEETLVDTYFSEEMEAERSMSTYIQNIRDAITR